LPPRHRDEGVVLIHCPAKGFYFRCHVRSEFARVAATQTASHVFTGKAKRPNFKSLSPLLREILQKCSGGREPALILENPVSNNEPTHVGCYNEIE
jgi:hypothetical protein